MVNNVQIQYVDVDIDNTPL